MRSPVRLLAALGCSSLVLAAAATARAEPSAWVAASGGAMGWSQTGSRVQSNGAASFDVGIGTAPTHPFIVGGLFRLAPLITQGSDLALLLRLTHRSFQAGGFGVAFDLGGYERFWGNTSRGFAGALVLGAPLGFQLSVQSVAGTDSAYGVGVLAGIDLLRLTVFRQTLQEWWPNPAAVQRRSAGLPELHFF